MTDRRCFLLHSNAFAAATITAGEGWVKPVSNLGFGDLFEHVARHVGGGVASFSLSWTKAQTVGGLALTGYTGPGGGRLRLTWRCDGEIVGAPRWEPLHQRVARTRDMAFSSPHWWSGRGDGKIFLDVPAAPLRADGLTVEIDTGGVAEFDLSHLFVAPLWRPAWPMAWGRPLNLASRTRISKTRAGGVIAGPRLAPQRSMQVTLEELADREREAWQRIAVAHDVVDPLLFVADPADRIAWGAEVFLARLIKLSGWRQVGPDRNQVVIEIEEVVA